MYYGDPVRLRQILLNLLSNAAKFTSNGVIDVRCQRYESTDGTSQVKLMVADTGTGIDPEQLPYLFEMFRPTRRFGGSGLGLAITKRLVEIMGGEITVKSQPDRGTKFKVTLPLREAPPE